MFHIHLVSDATGETLNAIAKAATALEAVKIAGDPSSYLAEFESRRPQGRGRYLTASELAQNQNRSLVTVLANAFGGLMSGPDQNRPGHNILLTRRSRPRLSTVDVHCGVDVYIDGSQFLEDLDALPESLGRSAFRIVQEGLWAEQERVRRQLVGEESERRQEAAVKERLRQLKLEAARERLQETMSPLEEGAKQLHAAIYESAAAIRSSLQKHQYLHGSSAKRARELARWFRLMCWQSDEQLEGLVDELERLAGERRARKKHVLREIDGVLRDLGELSTQFTAQGRSLAEAVQLLDMSNRRSEETVGSRQATIEALVTTLDARSDDFEQRLQRFSGLLDESLDAATTRTREIASLIAETSNESVRTIEQQYDLVRNQAEEERKRTSETLNAVYEEASTEAQALFGQSAERFTAIMGGMKQMAAEMQQELETTRAELRRGVLELPQETAERTAQMRRVIVDQIEALAELNRIVARHGRSLDAVEPIRREAEPVFAASGGRAQARPVRR